MTGKKLIVIEGFDRCGKDSLIQDLKDYNDFYIFENDLAGLPKYDKEQDDFLIWLNKFISIQIETINKLFDDHDNVVITRFLISDEVYSTLFNREHTVLKYIENLRKDIDIYNYCLLFKNYDEYLKRLEILQDNKIQYSKDNFYKINDLYENKLKTFFGETKYHIKNVLALDSREDIKNDFINYIQN